MKLIITSLNLQAFDDWTTRSPKILEYLAATNPDVALFQEVVFLPGVSPHNQAQLLNQQLRYPFQVSTISRLQESSKYPIYREGLALISKYPITSSDTLILKKAANDEHNRILQLIDILVDGRTMRLANIHYSITDVIDFATPHLEETLTILKARNEKRIMIGDFNLTHLEESAHLWENDYKASTAFEYISYPSMEKRVDYALIPNEYDFVSVSVSGDGLSDHRALTIEIETNE